MFHNYIGTQYKITKQVQIITTLFNYGHAVKTAQQTLPKIQVALRATRRIFHVLPA